MPLTLVAVTLASAAVFLALRGAPAVGQTGTRWRRGAPALLGPALVLLRPGPWLVLLAILLAAGAAGRLLWRRRVEAQLATHTTASVVEVCDLLAAELAAGRPPEAALDEAASAWPGLRPVADACRLGGDVPAALVFAAGAPGAGLAGSARRVADVCRLDQSTHRAVAGELSSARATARLVAGLPIPALLMGSGSGADPWRFLLATPPGLACLAGGLAFGLAGLWWIEMLAHAVDR